MRSGRGWIVTLMIVVSLAGGACGKAPAPLADQDQVHRMDLADIRLGDGVPLKLSLAVRWRIEDDEAFSLQFPEPAKYASLVFDPKAREVVGRVANGYASVASVFRPEREKFTEEMKQVLRQKLTEKGIIVKDVILADLLFPKNFTDALEVKATKEQELERIRQQSAIELEGGKAAQAKAAADGQVEIEKAKVAGKVAEINAEAENKRRLSLLAKAETEAQVLERRSKSEAERQRRLNEIELEKSTRLKDLAIKKQKELDDLAVARDRETAKVYAANPAYASFVVNRELASKVQIAVLPLGADAGVLGNLIQGTIGSGKR